MRRALHARRSVVDIDKVREVIEVIRPAIQADAGDIYLRDVDAEAGIVSVELVGACGAGRPPGPSRPASSASSRTACPASPRWSTSALRPRPRSASEPPLAY